MKLWRLVIIGAIFTGLAWTVVGVKAGSTGDFAIFIQKDSQQRTLYIVNEDGSGLHAIASGKEIITYPLGRHLLVYSDRQLYEYHRENKDLKLIAAFGKDVDYCYAFAMKPAGPDQALVVTGSQYSTFLRWYVLEFSDGSLRKINPPFDSVPGKSNELSPDEDAEAIIKGTTLGNRFELQVKDKKAGGARNKNVWIMPKTMTTLPAYPIWSPNSRMLAFYAKSLTKDEGLYGSYSLYIYDLDLKELILVQDQVFSITNFSKLEMGGFRPDWSGDSKYLIVQYQPFGLPTESSVLRYEIGSGKKMYINNGPGEKQYPAWSPSGNRILFLSSREGKGYQLYSMDSNGMNEKRLSPHEGITEWGKWLRF